MQLGSTIYIAGHAGLIGSAIRRRLKALGHSGLVLRKQSDLDLTRQQAVEEFLAWERPDYVFLAPADLGVAASGRHPAHLLYENLTIQSNIIEAAYQTGVKRLLFVDTSSIDSCPMLSPAGRQDSLPRQLESANRIRAIARTARIEMCSAYNRQRDCRFLVVMPPGLYGPHDTYDLASDRAVSAMIVNMHCAKVNAKREIVLHGPTDLRAEFLYSDDLADACIFLMNLPDHDFDFHLSSRAGPLINIGSEHDLTLPELAELVAEAVMFQGDVRFDTHRLSRARGKQISAAQSAILRSHPQMNIREGLQWAYNDFLSQIRTRDTMCFQQYAQSVGCDGKRLASPECRSRWRELESLEAASLSTGSSVGIHR
jgi:GDP-L-fucose synthase